MDDQPEQINSNEWYQIKEELETIIERYLTEKRKGILYDEEITIAVWYLVGSWEYYDNLDDYKYASVSALRVFASTNVPTILRQEMGEYYFEALCKMLEGMVEFCCTIKDDDLFMAELDQIRWGAANNSNMAIEIIKHVKNEYEQKLKNQEEENKRRKKR